MLRFQVAKTMALLQILGVNEENAFISRGAGNVWGSILRWVPGGSEGSQSTREQQPLLAMEAVVQLWSN